jgi:hypothetical protein
MLAIRSGSATGDMAITLPKNAPLSPITFWKSPRASGAAISALTENDPALSPKIVTFLGSPPKFAMFACTQRNAAAMSIRP